MKKPITVYAIQILNQKIARLKVSEQQLMQEISIAQKQGDLSENYEYHAAKKARNEVSKEIGDLSVIIASTTPTKLPENPTIVCFGSLVKLICEEKTIEYLILNDWEAEPKRGSIGISSLMFRSMLGKTPGDTFVLSTPEIQKKYEIISIRGVTEEEYKERAGIDSF